ncbi:hypothetical protein FSP39_005204 [Pinctada imbricata]|uniref:Uncharacterized protein n=1 Tax=Pinctada imbricata TaxID=66713 RepID=A0AA89BRB6_PINIB|nr:hypothetical protein FSP39_005204 [Pinctada imbricata]
MITPYYNRSDETAMNKKKMSTHILGVGILMVAVLILTIALIFGLEFPKFVRNRLIDDQCVVDSGHKFYTKWVQESDFIKYTLLYFWNTTNVDEFLEGHQQPQVSNLLGAACGGLIGMSALSIIVVVISALVVIVPRGMNRVAPAPQPSEHMNGTHTPV